MQFPKATQFINIHTHRKPQSANEWVLRNAFHFPIFYERLGYAVSIGIHPWHTHHAIEHFSPSKVVQQTSILAIGEIGLDRRCNVPIEQQKYIFERQLRWAVELQKPVIIHAVKSYADLLFFMKKYQLTWILHAFRGKNEMLSHLMDFDCYFSFGKEAWDPAIQISSIPLNRIFAETDNTTISIADVYTQLANRYEISVEQLKQNIYQNFITVFKT